MPRPRRPPPGPPALRRPRASSRQQLSRPPLVALHPRVPSPPPLELREALAAATALEVLTGFPPPHQGVSSLTTIVFLKELVALKASAVVLAVTANRVATDHLARVRLLVHVEDPARRATARTVPVVRTSLAELRVAP